MNQGQHGFSVPNLTFINKYLLILMGSFLIINTITTEAFSLNLVSLTGLTSHKFLNGHIYQILTYPLVASSFMQFLFNGLLIWFVGSEFENLWPKKRYIYFILTSILSGAFLYLLGALFFSSSPSSFIPVSGLGAFASALCLAYGVIFPDRYFSIMLVFPIKAKYFCIVLVLMNIFSGVSGGRGLHSLVHLGSMLGAFIFMLYVTNKKINLKSPSAFKKLRPKKNHLSLVKDDNESDKPPKYWH